MPLNFRVANKDTSLPLGGGPDQKSPVYIKKGDAVAYSVWAMHRRTDFYGPDAHVFRPERWEENGRHGWEYLPFNGGPRICLGREFSLFLVPGGQKYTDKNRTICSHGSQLHGGPTDTAL